MACALASACGGDDAPEGTAAGPLSVSVQEARTETLRDVLAAPGMIVPASATDWSVTATEPARIAELPKAEGDAVQTGDLLVRLEMPSVNDQIVAAEALVAEAQVRAANARAEVAKLAPLFESGVIARAMFDTAKTAASNAATALEAVEAKRDAAKQQIDRGLIRARFPGIVIKRFHNEGEFVAGTPTDAILRVIDPNKVQVLVQVPLSRFSRVLPGHAAMVQSGGGPAEAAVVASRTGPQDPMATTAEIRLGFVTATALTIDLPVQIEMTLEERRDVIVGPSAAILRDGTSAYVFVVGDDGIARRRDVRTGLAVGQVTQIVSGLVAGERIITSNLDQISDGTPVSVR